MVAIDSTDAIPVSVQAYLWTRLPLLALGVKVPGWRYEAEAAAAAPQPAAVVRRPCALPYRPHAASFSGHLEGVGETPVGTRGRVSQNLESPYFPGQVALGCRQARHPGILFGRCYSVIRHQSGGWGKALED